MRKAIILGFIVLMAAHCAENQRQTAEEYDASLIVLDGSRNVRYSKNQGNDQLSYIVNVDYPAKDEIQDIRIQLEASGWAHLDEDFLNPGIKSSFARGWSTFVDGTKSPNTQVHQWIMDFQNKREDIVRYVFRYEYPLDGVKDVDTLKVAANYMPAEIVRKILEQIKKQEGQSPNKAL